jgi:hypothetical protein
MRSVRSGFQAVSARAGAAKSEAVAKRAERSSRSRRSVMAENPDLFEKFFSQIAKNIKKKDFIFISR